MPTNLFLHRLRKGEVLLGLCNMYPAAGIVEGMCPGWDFVWIDGQHGQIQYDAALAAIRAAAVAGVETMLRAPGHEPSSLCMYADLAPSSILVPMVNTPEQAKQVVSSILFHPLGQRSYGGRRAIDLYGRSYYRDVELAVIAQIETLEAAANAEAIINTEGIDLLFFGPDDMKVSMDLPINTNPTDNQQVIQAMQRTADAARKAGKFACCVAGNAKAANIALEMGFQVMVGGGDSGFIRSGSTDKLNELRNATGGKTVGRPVVQPGSEIYGD